MSTNNDDDEIPTFGFHSVKNHRGDWAYLWCPACHRWHHHGRTKSRMHRVAHCVWRRVTGHPRYQSVSDLFVSPYPRGYNLVDLGPASKAVLQAIRRGKPVSAEAAA